MTARSPPLWPRVIYLDKSSNYKPEKLITKNNDNNKTDIYQRVNPVFECNYYHGKSITAEGQ